MNDNNKFRPSLEMLETREVPALTGGLSNGVLRINGSTGGDTITLTQSGSQIRIGGYTNAWSAGQVSNVVINGGAGNDTITLGVDPKLAARSYVDGGTGTDTIRTTAKPAQYTNFEYGSIISYTGGSSSSGGGSSNSGTQQNTAGVQIVRTGNTGPYSVSYYRRGSPNSGELHGNYNTIEQANQAVAGLLKWAAEIKANNAYYGVTNGYWEIAKITVEGTGTSQGGTGSQTTNAQDLARQILNNSRITLANAHSSGTADNATARMNIWYASLGYQAMRSSYGNAPGGSITLSANLLAGMIRLSQRYTIGVSEIAGGSHSVGSAHYYGRTLDINYVNGVHVSGMTVRYATDFANYAYSLGAKRVIGPHNDPRGHWNHFHIEW